jgi:hypothetical protein
MRLTSSTVARATSRFGARMKFMSACLAAKRRPAGLTPALMIGGSGRCSGLGSA